MKGLNIYLSIYIILWTFLGQIAPYCAMIATKFHKHDTILMCWINRNIELFIISLQGEPCLSPYLRFPEVRLRTSNFCRFTYYCSYHRDQVNYYTKIMSDNDRNSIVQVKSSVTNFSKCCMSRDKNFQT